MTADRRSDAIARAKKALRDAERGIGLVTLEEFFDRMGERAIAAGARIRAAVASKKKGT